MVNYKNILQAKRSMHIRISLFILLGVIILAGACAPIPLLDKATEGPPIEAATEVLPTESATQDKIVEALNAMKTQEVLPSKTPLPTFTPKPSPTATPMPTLPVAYNQQMPGELVPMTAANLKDLKLVGTIGEGSQHSVHKSPDKKRLVIVYSTGIDIFQKINGRYELEKRLDFDVYGSHNAFGSERDAYVVSESTHFFAQNYGDRVRVLNLNTGDENSLSVSKADVGGWNFPIQRLFFSPNENYLLVDGTSDQVLIDLKTLEKVLSVETQGGQSYFTKNEDYLIISRTYQGRQEIYALPDVELVAENDKFSYLNNPGWATITSDGQLISAGTKFFTILNFPSMEKVYEDILSAPYYGIGQVTLTEDEQFVIIGHRNDEKRGISIWDVNEHKLVKFFPSVVRSENYVLSPSQAHLVVYIDKDKAQIVTFPEGEVLETLNGYGPIKFMETTDYLIIYFQDQFSVFDLTENKYIALEEAVHNGQAIQFNVFFGMTKSHLFAYDSENGYSGYVKYNLGTGEVQLLGSNKNAIIEDESFEEIEFQSSMGFDSFQNRSTSFRTSYYHIIRQITGEQGRYANHYQANPIVLSNAIKWDLDSFHLANAVNYLSVPVSNSWYAPYLRNVISADKQLEAERGQGTLKILDVKSGELLHTFNNLGVIFNFKFSFDSSLIFITGIVNDRPRSPVYLKVYEIRTGNLKKHIEFSNNPWFYSYGPPMDLSPDGKYLAFGNKEGKLDIIDLSNNWAVKYTLDILHNLNDADVQFSPDGSYFATVTIDDKIQFWNTETGELINEIDVLGGYGLNDYYLVQFYLLDNLILTSDFADFWWGLIGQMKAYGIVAP